MKKYVLQVSRVVAEVVSVKLRCPKSSTRLDVRHTLHTLPVPLHDIDVAVVE